MRPLEVKLLRFVGIAALLALLAAVLFPLFAPTGHVPRLESLCLSHMRRTSLGLVMYSSDFDDRFPPRDTWMDATVPDTKDEAAFHCPSVPKGAYGYAFNGVLSRFDAKKLDDVATTPLAYDSVNPIRNASDLVASLPFPKRHNTKEDGGRNVIAYTDGHVKAVSPRAKP